MKVKTYEIGNAIVKVYRPDLDEKEEAKVHRDICIALQQYGKEVHDIERKEVKRAC